MDVVHDEDFGAIWANHFPQRRESEASRMLLETLVEIMLKREEFRTGQDFDETLDRVLASLRIPPSMSFMSTSERSMPRLNNDGQYQPPPFNEYLTVSGAARILEVTRSANSLAIRRGRLKSQTVGHVKLIAKADLEAYRKSRKAQHK